MASVASLDRGVLTFCYAHAVSADMISDKIRKQVLTEPSVDSPAVHVPVSV